MTESENIVSLSGAKIFRYTDGENEWEAPQGEECIEEISNHIEKHVGKINSVLHELISDTVHIDIHHVLPTTETPLHFLVTSGMSDLPMTVSKDPEELKYLELMIVLPGSWEISSEAFNEERCYWPIRQLKYLARFPHKYNSWFGYGHTIPNGNPAEPFAENTKLDGIILLTPSQVPSEFLNLKINDNKTIEFLVVFPLYPEEMELKLRKGSDALLNKLIENGIDDIVVIDRKNVAKKRFGIF
jgi:hypothetical protein